MTEAMKQKRQHLAELSRVIKMKIQQGITNAATVNEGLIELYSEGDESLEFNTFFEWKKKGFSIKKGSHAFLVWGKPRKIPVIDAEKDSDQEDEFKFWPVAYLFSENQVEKSMKEKEVAA